MAVEYDSRRSLRPGDGRELGGVVFDWELANELTVDLVSGRELASELTGGVVSGRRAAHRVHCRRCLRPGVGQGWPPSSPAESLRFERVGSWGSELASTLPPTESGTRSPAVALSPDGELVTEFTLSVASDREGASSLPTALSPTGG
jgi:hypothetical protein